MFVTGTMARNEPRFCVTHVDRHVMARDIQDNVHKMQSTCLANSKELGRSVSIWLLRRRGSNQYLELRPAHTCDVLVACSTS